MSKNKVTLLLQLRLARTIRARVLTIFKNVYNFSYTKS